MGLWLVIAALDGAAFVVIGAAGGHGVIADATLQRLFDTASDYHAWHALALLAVAMGQGRLEGAARRLASVAAMLWLVGTVLFSGSLYIHAFIGAAPIPAATPVGGASLIFGWLVLAAAGLVVLRRSRP
jgi:uncharacterized membrane protein YgdD (TMEM256/DUF423 family)